MFSFQSFFPLIALVVCGLSWLDPDPLMAWSNELPMILMIIMFCIGLTIPKSDGMRIVHKPEALAFGIVLQFLMMPLISWILIQLLPNEEGLTSGILLTSLCSGTVIAVALTFIAKGDTTLAVCLNLLSALWSVFSLPWLITFMSSGQIEIELKLADTLASLLTTMLIPVAAGHLLNWFLPSFRQMVENYLGDAISLATIFALGVGIASASEFIQPISIAFLLAMTFLCLGTLALGYGLSRQQGFSPAASRAIALQLAMQNTQQSTHLAFAFFPPVAAVIPSVYQLIQSVIGATFASGWQVLIQRRIRQARQSGGSRVRIHDQDA